MSGITLKKTVAASIPTPATDKATIFLDDATDAPAYKDDAGVTTPIGSGGGASFATPAIVLGTAAAAGAAATVIRSDSTVVAFDATSPTTQAFGDSAAVGAAAVASRRDHKHAMMALPAIDATAAATDITTRNVSTTAHGLTPKLPNDATRYLDGTGAYSTPAGGPVVQITAGSASGNAGALAAATALDAAIAAMPAQGGKIQISRGYVTYTALPGPNLGSRNIDITGLGSVTGGADAATIIEYTGTGTGTFVNVADATSPGLHDLEVLYTNTGFTGTLVGSSASTIQCSSLNLENVLLKGSTAVGQTATLLDINRSIVGTFNRVFFNGGGIGVNGRRAVAVSGISIANPSVITAVAHGYTTGQTVYFGAVATTPVIAVNPPTTEGYVITVTGADTFTIPVNITATTDVAGWVSSTIDFCNVQTFRDCEFVGQRIVPVRNPGESFVFINPTIQSLASGDLAFIDHLPGCRAKGLTITGGGIYDQTTTNPGNVIAFAGTGLSVVGFKGSGRQVSQITFIKIDESGCQGIVALGNALDNMYIGLDLSTMSNTSGQFGPNAYNNVVAGWKAVNSTAVRDGIEIMDNAGSLGRVGTFIWDDNVTSTMLQFDGDTVCRIYRLSAGVFYSPADWNTAGDIRAGYAEAITTRVYGAGSNAGLAAEGSNTNIDISLLPKGTGRIILTARAAAGVPSGAPTGTELPIAFDSTAVSGGVYYWTGAAWVKGGTI